MWWERRLYLNEQRQYVMENPTDERDLHMLKTSFSQMLELGWGYVDCRMDGIFWNLDTQDILAAEAEDGWRVYDTTLTTIYAYNPYTEEYARLRIIKASPRRFRFRQSRENKVTPERQEWRSTFTPEVSD